MQRSLGLSLSLSGVAALALSNGALLPVAAQDVGSADDLGVMEINLKDAVKFNWGFQGALQGAGTPNQAGIGGFLPLSVGENSVFFADVLLNANFADYGGNSSIINTEVAGTTISTSSRLGYRWLNSDRSWMYGVNGGYDSRPMNTGNAETGVTLYDKESAFFQQIAAGLEAVSDTWNFNAYALVPVGDTEQRLNSRYVGGALDTYGLDVGYFITPELNTSIGYYYQQGDLGEADGSGVQAGLDYQIADGLTAGINVSYDESFETRVSGNIEYRFGSNTTAAETKKKAWQKPTIQALSESVKNRNIRVHDAIKPERDSCFLTPGGRATGDDNRREKIAWRRSEGTNVTRAHAAVRTPDRGEIKTKGRRSRTDREPYKLPPWVPGERWLNRGDAAAGGYTTPEKPFPSKSNYGSIRCSPGGTGYVTANGWGPA